MMILDNLSPPVAETPRNRLARERKRFLKFAAVGAVGAVLDISVLNLLVQGFGVLPLVANPFAVGAAILSNFTWNRLWAFPESRQRPLLPQFGQFVLINLVGLAINQVIFGIMHSLVLPRWSIQDPLNYNLAKAVAIGIVLFWNFGLNRLTTYRGL